MRRAANVFSFKGRASRREFWLQSLGALALYILSWVGLTGLLIPAELATTGMSKAAEGRFTDWVFGSVFAVLVFSFFLYIWALLAVASRRYHDLGRPFRLRVLENGGGFGCLFRRGTPGANVFGPDPLSKP